MRGRLEHGEHAVEEMQLLVGAATARPPQDACGVEREPRTRCEGRPSVGESLLVVLEQLVGTSVRAATRRTVCGEQQRIGQREDPLFGRGVLLLAVLQGLGVLAGVAAVYAWGVVDGWQADVVRSATFVALVAGNLALILTNRSWRLSLVRTLLERRNPVLPWILGGAVLLLIAVLGVPGLRGALGFGPLGVDVALVAGAAASAGILWFEGWKAVSRRRA